LGALGGPIFLVCGRDAPGHVISVEDKHILQIYCFTGPFCHSSRVQYLTQYSMAIGMANLEPTTNHTLQNTLYTITCCCIKLQLRKEKRRAGEGGGVETGLHTLSPRSCTFKLTSRSDRRWRNRRRISFRFPPSSSLAILGRRFRRSRPSLVLAGKNYRTGWFLLPANTQKSFNGNDQ